MVFEYMDHDLTGLADRPGMRFSVAQIKVSQSARLASYLITDYLRFEALSFFPFSVLQCYMKQLLTGLHYCHVNQVLHRDIKGYYMSNSSVIISILLVLWAQHYVLNFFAGSNLLIDNEGNLKLADFGLARSFSNDHNANLTNRVITLWYRWISNSLKWRFSFNCIIFSHLVKFAL